MPEIPAAFERRCMPRARRASVPRGALSPAARMWHLCSTAAVLLLAVSTLAAPQDASAQERDRAADTVSTLGLDQGVQSLEVGPLRVKLVRASQTVAALQPEDQGGFDFTPNDWLERRAADGYFHLGDLTLRLRWEA